MNEPAAPSANRPAINDCWNSIGVRGDGSCPELQTHIHCRNCPVYSSAATKLLDSEPPAGYLADWTGHYAAEQRLAEAGCESVVIFRMADEWLAFSTVLLVEVASIRTLHILPHRSGGIVLGLANVRGELLVCISLTGMLGIDKLPSKHGHGAPRLLVMSRAGEQAAFPVDEVFGTHRFHPRELKVAPATVSKSAAPFVKAVLTWDGKTVGLLDDELIFHAVGRSLA